MLSDAKIRAAKARDKAYKLTDSHRCESEPKRDPSPWSYKHLKEQKNITPQGVPIGAGQNPLQIQIYLLLQVFSPLLAGFHFDAYLQR